MDVLQNKRLKQYDRLSRYSTFPFYYHALDEKYIYGTSNHLKTNTAYTLYRVKKGDTLDSLALQAYSNPTLYWVIADFNRIQDPFCFLIEGTQIKIPVISEIEFRS